MNYFVINSSNEPISVSLLDGNEKLSIINNSAEIIDTVVAEIYKGNLYTANHFFSAVANNGYADMHILTNSTKQIHLSIAITTEAKSYVTIYRGGTYTNIGTNLTVYNNNGNSINTTTALIYYSPTAPTGTIKLFEDFIPAGSGARVFGGNFALGSQMILKPSTDYLIRVQNVGGNSITSDTTITLSYYEI